MHKLHFGTAGIPTSTPDRTTLNGIAHVSKLNLDGMELEFVRSINISKEKAPEVKAAAKQHNIILTCHGQYFVNLNAKDPATLSASIKRITDAATRAYECGAWSICFHIAHYMKDTHDVAYDNVKRNLKTVIKHMKDNSIPITIRPETGGKVSQFSDIDGLIKLSQEVEQVLPCIDWAHHCARTNGKVNNYTEFKNILIKLENGLGKDILNNMHMHIEGIQWTEKGEKNHLIFSESDFKYQEAIKAWKEFNLKGVATCESPNIEVDALIAKKIFEAK